MRRWGGVGWVGWWGGVGGLVGGWGVKSHLVTVDKCNLAVSVLPRACTCYRCYTGSTLSPATTIALSQIRLNSRSGMHEKLLHRVEPGVRSNWNLNCNRTPAKYTSLLCYWGNLVMFDNTIRQWTMLCPSLQCVFPGQLNSKLQHCKVQFWSNLPMCFITKVAFEECNAR